MEVAIGLRYISTYDVEAPYHYVDKMGSERYSGDEKNWGGNISLQFLWGSSSLGSTFIYSSLGSEGVRNATVIFPPFL